jgi:hypothetical protein
MLAICLALPYVAMAVCRAQSAAEVAVERKKRHHVKLVPAQVAVRG